MNNSILKKEISNTLEALHEQTEIILSHQGRIPQIELDIAMGNIRKLYEDFHLLDKENNQEKPAVKKDDPPSADEKKEETALKPEAEKLETEKTSESIQAVENEPMRKSGEEELEKPEPTPQREQPKPVPETKKIEAEKPEPEPAPEPRPEPADPSPSPADKTNEPQAREKPERPAKREKETLRTADLFADNNTLADKFRNEKDGSLGARMQNNKIKDLKDAIGINEKFLFINDLFDGNMQDYNNAVENINSMGTMEQARSVISNLKTKYKWDVKPDAVNHFMSYVERRFSNE